MRLLLTKRNLVVDAGVLALFFGGDERVKSYFREIETTRKNGYVTSVNLSEFYYKTCEKLGEDVAKLRYYQSRELLKVLETDQDLSLSAGREKCHNPGNLSLADCFALGAAKKLDATILTTDSELAKTKEVEAKHFKVT